MTRPHCPPPGLRLDRRTRRVLVCIFVALAVVGLVAIQPGRGPSALGSWSERLPAGGFGLVVLGLAAGRDDGLDDLVEEIRRYRAGEGDVDFSTDRDDEVGDLYAAVGDMASAIETCERERKTARNRVEETERQLEQYRALVESASDPMAVLDAGGRFEVINEAMESFHGTDRDELLGTDARHLVATASVEAIEDAQRRLLSDPGRRWEQVVVDLTDAEGDERRFEANVGVLRDGDGCFDGSVLTLRDVTERVEIDAELHDRERRLQETNERLNAIIEASPDGLVVLDLDGNVELWNPAAEDIFGWSADEVVGDRPPFVPEEGTKEFDRNVSRLADGETLTGVEVRRLRRDGEPVDVNLSAAPLRDDGGEIVAIMGILEDITERKQYERDLEEHKEYTSDILDAIDDVFYVIDGEGNFLRWNESARAVTGYDDEEIASTNAFAFFPEEYHPRIIAAMEEVFGSTGGRRVEAPLVTKEGEGVPYEFVATTVENPAGEEVLVGVGRDISERKRREAALERATELLEQAQRIAKVGGWEFDMSTEELTVTDEFRRLHALDTDEVVTLEEIIAAYHPDDVAYIEEMLEAAIESGEGYDMEVRLRADGGATRWVRALGEPVETDGQITKIRGSVQDITEAKEREEAIRSLHDAAQRLLQTESSEEVATLVVETAADVLDASGVCLYLLDRDTSQLVPEACTVDFEEMTGGAPPIPVGDEDDPVWNSYATGTRQVVDDNEENGDTGLFTDAVGGGLVVPLGEYGVFVVTTARAGVAVRTRQLVETLIATTEAAFDRLESEASLRERDAELEARNRRLRRQIQVTDVIRRVDRSLVGANSREEIEMAVCEGLAGSEDIAFAWIGSRDTTGEELVPQTWAGEGDAYLDGISQSLSSGATEPAVTTAMNGEPTVVSNVLADVSGEAWRKPALDCGFRSVLAIPIAFEEYRHGVLAVYADEEGAFGDLEQTVFAELGQTIANAINAVQTREALHADTLVEVTLRVEAPDTFLAQVARRADCDVEYVGIGRQSGDETSVFFATDGAAEVEGVLDGLVTVAEHRLLSERDGRRVYEATVTGTVLPARLLRHGAQPKSIHATPTDVSVVVSVPTSTDVREFVEMLREAYPSVELEGRRNVTRATRTRQQMVSDLLEGLTERQLEVLRTAYYAGYFQWPRGSSGEEIAEMLGVSQPTVSRHLRLGQHRLLAQLIEEEPTTVTAS